MTWTSPDSGPARRAVGTAGLFVHPIGLDGSIFGWAAGPDETATVLDVYSSEGGNFVSTADHYAGGRSEVMIGSWLRSRRIRNEMVIATKVGRHPDNPGLDPRSVIAAVDASLERLGVEHIDLVSLDGESRDVPIEDTLGAMAQLLAAGKIRAVGVSSFSAAALARCEAAADRGLPEVGATILEYNLLRRAEYEQNIQPFAVRHSSCGLARLPLANGFLFGDFRRKDDFPTEGMFKDAANYAGKTGTRVLGVLDQIAEELDATPGRIAAAWVISRPGIASAIARCRDALQVAEFLTAARLHLSPEHVARLDKASS